MSEYNLNKLRDDVLIIKERIKYLLKQIGKEEHPFKTVLQEIQGKLAWMQKNLDEALEDDK